MLIAGFVSAQLAELGSLTFDLCLHLCEGGAAVGVDRGGVLAHLVFGHKFDAEVGLHLLANRVELLFKRLQRVCVFLLLRLPVVGGLVLAAERLDLGGEVGHAFAQNLEPGLLAHHLELFLPLSLLQPLAHLVQVSLLALVLQADRL